MINFVTNSADPIERAKLETIVQHARGNACIRAGHIIDENMRNTLHIEAEKIDTQKKLAELLKG